MLTTYTHTSFNKFTRTLEKTKYPCKVIEFLDKGKVSIKILTIFNNQPNPTITVNRKYVYIQEEKQLINFYEPCQNQ